MSTITIAAKDFLSGEAQWDYIPNHGFSPDSTNLNLLLKPGTLNFGYTQTDRGGATLVGNIVASTYDKNYLGNDTYHVDDAGNFYTLSGPTFTKRQTVTADTFQLGTSDMIQFKGNTYATSLTRIIQLTASNLTSVDSSWWTGLTTSHRHPLEVVEDKMYIGDVNVVYYFDGTTSGTAVTLPSDCDITSLRRHPDGRHLIAFTGYQANFSHTNGGPGKIYIINKDTQVWEREILIDNQVEGSRTVGGIVYCTWGKKLGYYTGSGVKFLKQLKTSATTYSQSMGNMEDLLIVRDGTNALMYGDIGGGEKVWHNFYNGSTINNIIYKGQNLILVATSAATLVELDYGTATVSGTFTSKRYNFGTIVKIRRMDILHGKKATGSIMVFNVYSRDTENTQTLVKNVNYPAGPIITKTRIEMDVTTDMFQFQINPSNNLLEIKLIRFYYDPIN